MDAAAEIFIEYSGKKLKQLTGRIEVCLDKLSEAQIWARGGENENAVGNLVLHLCGNVRQWIVSGVGGAPDSRQRDAEFSARNAASAFSGSASELKRRLRTTIEEASAAIGALPSERLAERITVQGYDVSVLEALYHVVEHFSMHTGQIVFATKMLTGADLGFYAHLRSATVHGQQTP